MDHRPRTRHPMTTMRKTALAAGVLYLVTFVGIDPGPRPLGTPSLDHAGLRPRRRQRHRRALGRAASRSSSAPRRHRHRRRAVPGRQAARAEPRRIGFVTSRDARSRHDLRRRPQPAVDRDAPAGRRRHRRADTASLLTTSRSLVALHDWTFLFGPGFMPAINALFLATVMYRFRLVPRIIPMIGLVGAPLLLASGIATMFGGLRPDLVDRDAVRPADRGLGVLARLYMIVKGFRSTAAHRRPGPGTRRARRPPRHRIRRLIATTPCWSRPRGHIGDGSGAIDRSWSNVSEARVLPTRATA